ncbi:hypothetical protein [Halobacillus massiliensis]|uniref:hypothetical protein n=1 Tax=Halobacillus massiliensis TaxID=1926286 RepID=UPI0009E58C94|nr:hypothetical protein [Halobacillus massiliensis]
MEPFPIIHTNFWDAVLAVPSVIILTQIFKMTFPIPKALIPTLANVLGLFISIFISHPNNIWAGIFMGFFYGNAAVGVYASLKTSYIAFKRRKRKSSYAKA